MQQQDITHDLDQPAQEVVDDEWDDHFQVGSFGTLFGKTPIGRVTIACLEINSQSQITARQLWIRLGLFP